MRRVEVTPDTEEWAKARQDGIGASEAAAVAGVSRWRVPLDVYHEKRGETLPFAGNERTRMGHLLEPIVAGLWAERLQMDVLLQPGMFESSEHPCIRATPDAKLSDTEGLEIKAVGERTGQSLGPDDSDDIPVDWYMQAQQQMYVMGWEIVHFGVLVGGQKLCNFIVDRDEETIEQVVQSNLWLWERVKAGEPPAADWEHPGTIECIRKRFPDADPEKRVTFPPAVVRLWRQSEQVAEEIKRLDKLKKMLRAQVEESMGDAGMGDFGDGYVLRRRLQQKRPYTVKPKPSIELRKVKNPTLKKGRK